MGVKKLTLWVCNFMEAPSSNTITKMSVPFLVSLEGNIGSGKSTLLKKLREARPDWMFVDEPVDSWMSIKNDNGDNLLEVFYRDIKRWSYTFQNAAVLSRGIMVEEAVKAWQAGNKKTKVILMERCVETDKNVFAKMLKADGMLNGIEWSLYNKWYEYITQQIPKINLFIWVNTEANVCAERIKIRNRQGEDGISLDYLQNLEKTHTEWLTQVNTSEVFASCDVDEVISKIDQLSK